MRSMAAKYSTLKVDFMEALPLEFIEIIINKLFVDEEVYPQQLCEYLSISRLWQQRILECARDLHVVSSGGSRFGEYVLKQSAPHITALTLQYKAAPYQLFHRARFSSLQSLALYEVLPNHPNPTAVFASLALVRSTLTHLEIHFRDEEEPYSIDSWYRCDATVPSTTSLLDTTTTSLGATMIRSSHNRKVARILNDIRNMETYLIRPDVMSVIGAQVQKYTNCNDGFGSQFSAHDWMRPYVDEIAPLLEDGIRILLPWSGHEEFAAAKDTPWFSTTANEQGSELRRTKDGRFAFLRVFDSGHMVPMDRGDYAIDMLNNWLHEELV